jgi:hypothetical protein
MSKEQKYQVAKEYVDKQLKVMKVSKMSGLKYKAIIRQVAESIRA